MSLYASACTFCELGPNRVLVYVPSACLNKLSVQEVKPIEWAKYEKDIDPEMLADFKKSFEGEAAVVARCVNT